MSASPKDQIDADRKALEKLAASDSGDQWEAVETDEPTPEDADARHRTLVRLLKANLAGNAVLARVMLRHDDWLQRVGKVWGVVGAVAKRAWPAGLVIVARPGIIPDWVWEALKTIWSTSSG
jgi:hypothetical protein